MQNKPNPITEKYIQEFNAKFVKHVPPRGASGQAMIYWKVTGSLEEIEEWLASTISEVQRETAEDICIMLDQIESQDANTSMEQWKHYKHIRNRIRDKYVLKDNL